ncbi:MAG TPA: glycoside hydrolase family 38 C-terminal domain-containing protein [Candidatus Hydrogenedentes bacterium]|nr:glycoside hydrolase family 38 C-terminal domain-containing protein [Candidatus Hydrogenedentota bacterium]
MRKQSKPTVHMIGHGHIDPTWLWRWTEGYEEVRSTFRSALDRMNETPEFKFTASSACFYRWVKTVDPLHFQAIQQRVKEGRWEIAGGFWVEPDCNIPCGESFVRHGLYSQRFFMREFGVRANVGFNPDSFGHTGALPQILKKLGIDYYVYMRPCPIFEMNYPGGTTFWWEAADGSRVLACNLQETYNADDCLRDRIQRLVQSPHLNPDQTHILGFYGVGNHGGGPTKRMIQTIKEMQKEKDAPTVEFSSLMEYFEAFEKTMDLNALPVMRQELQHHARGCYSAHAEMKRLNRRVEHALMTAERFATAAWLLDSQPYPHDQFEKAWTDLLYNQFHDVLAGTSIESAYEDTFNQLGAARHRADMIINQSIQSVARDIDTSALGNTIVVFNPLTWDVTQPVVLSQIVERSLENPLHVVDDRELPVPSQKIRGERVNGRRYVFTAEVPAMGYRIYHARSGIQPAAIKFALDAGKDFIENEWWKLTFDPVDGHLCGVFDKHRRTEVLRAGNMLTCLNDTSDTWGHDVQEYRVETGRFGQAKIALVEHGDVLATMQIHSRFERSSAIQEITLYRDSEMIDCQLRVNWQEQYRLLKLTFETNIQEGIAIYETAYGHEIRPTNGHEEPGQQWFDLTGTLNGLPYGLAILNDGQYGFDVRDGVMRVTLLRSPAYAHHDPARFDATAGFPIMDQGWHLFHFRLVPHTGTWQEARIVKQGWELNAPLFAHVESAHPGKRPPKSKTLVGTEAANVLLSVVKQSEEGEDLIVRGYEIAGQPADTTLHIPLFNKQFPLHFTAHEIKTIRIDPRTWSLRETNLLEE